jgi:hypothetical protein
MDRIRIGETHGRQLAAQQRAGKTVLRVGTTVLRAGTALPRGERCSAAGKPQEEHWQAARPQEEHWQAVRPRVELEES